MNKSDYIEAARDAVKIRGGILHPIAAHPNALGMLSSDRLLTDIAEYFGANASASKSRSSSPHAAFTAGLSSSDFKTLLSDVVRSATINHLTTHSAHRGFCAVRPVRDFKPYMFPQADIDMELEEIIEGGEAASTITLETNEGLSSKLHTYGKNIFISDVTIRNDDITLISSLFANTGATAARREAAVVYSLIESNPVLGDGEYMFHTGHGNIVAAALDFTGLQSGMAALRNQLTPSGNLADLSAVFLIVAPDLELTALHLSHQSGLKINVIASPWLPAGRWYLMAHPDIAPVIGLLRLGSTPDGVSVGPTRDKAVRAGVSLAIRVDSGAVALARVGIIKGGV